MLLDSPTSFLFWYLLFSFFYRGVRSPTALSVFPSARSTHYAHTTTKLAQEGRNNPTRRSDPGRCLCVRLPDTTFRPDRASLLSLRHFLSFFFCCVDPSCLVMFIRENGFTGA